MSPQLERAAVGTPPIATFFTQKGKSSRSADPPDASECDGCKQPASAKRPKVSALGLSELSHAPSFVAPLEAAPHESTAFDDSLSQRCTQAAARDTPGSPLCEDEPAKCKPASKLGFLHSKFRLKFSSESHADRIHGNIRMPDLCWRILNTKEFQRLRGTMQLGLSIFAFPCATHSRFEHSVGVMHLAHELVENLKGHLDTARSSDQQLAIELPTITAADKLCVMVAALCHDLGHGPFSHAFEEVAHELQKHTPAPSHGVTERELWSHEENSIKMLRYLLRENRIDLAEYGLDPVLDLIFIEEMIHTNPWRGDPSKRRGRSADKG